MFVDSFLLVIYTFSNVIAAVVLISILLPWFLITAAVVITLCAMAYSVYRVSSREIKVRTVQIRYRDSF